jgi:DNA-binding transcriptional ArsR family regulator
LAGTWGSDDCAGPVYSFGPVLLLFADDEAGLAPARAAAAAAGCRIAGEAGIAGGAARLAQQIGANAALLSLSAPSAEANALLAGLAAEVRSGRMQGIVALPAAMIDPVFAADLPMSVEQLVAPDAAELERAIAAATQRPAARLHDGDRREGPNVLQQLSEEAARIASVLASLSMEESGEAERDEGGEEGDGVDPVYVRSIIRARRMRDQYFRAELFADPAFDMLLDLYAARLEGSRVAVSSLCIAAAVPATTALRWIKALTDKGLFVRQADPQDGRRVYIALSDEAGRAMGRYLAAVQRSGGVAL